MEDVRAARLVNPIRELPIWRRLAVDAVARAAALERGAEVDVAVVAGRRRLRYRGKKMPLRHRRDGAVAVVVA